MAMIQQLLLSGILLSQMAMLPADGYRADFCVAKNTSYHADPEDCTRFYQCFLKYAYSMMCPPGLFYNEKLSVCDWPYNVACGQRNTPSLDATAANPTSGSSSNTPTTPTTTSWMSFTSTLFPPFKPDNTLPGNATQNPNSPSATFCLTRVNKLYSDPDKCNSFYQCNNGYTYHFTCQEDLLFNAEQQYCDWTWNIDCSVPKEDVSNRSRLYNSDDQAANAVVNTRKAEDCGKVLCYFPNWAPFRDGAGAKFGPDDIDTKLCTHVIYAFAKLIGNRLVASSAFDEYNDGIMGNFVRATNLKMKNPNLKVLVAVGGWRMEPSLFSNMSASEGSRAEFITSTINFLRVHTFDGLSLDWVSFKEEPSIYRERHTRLFRELRQAFDNEAFGEKRLLLTGAVFGSKSVIDTQYDIPQISAALDFINVLSYDLHGVWDGRTGHGSPLKAGHWESDDAAKLNVEWVANYWASQGAPKNKLVIGVPLYGRSYTLMSPSRSEVGARINGLGLPGKYTKESGYLSYYEICSMMSASIKYVIDSQRVRYLVSGDQWVGYEDPASVKEKVKFIKENGFAGIVAWDISLDDFSGTFCGQGSFPLMNAMISQC